jgi:hypothetical protein
VSYVVIRFSCFVDRVAIQASSSACTASVPRKCLQCEEIFIVII